jgi:hypothetical protein
MPSISLEKMAKLPAMASWLSDSDVSVADYLKQLPALSGQKKWDSTNLLRSWRTGSLVKLEALRMSTDLWQELSLPNFSKA